MIRIVAPEGYKLLDKRTRKQHSEVVTDEKNRDRYELVPETKEPETVEIAN